MVINQLMNPNFSDIHSVVLDNTMHTVFKNLTRVQMVPYDAWSKKNYMQNVMYTYFNAASPTDRIYTDNLNRQMFDRNMKASQ